MEALRNMVQRKHLRRIRMCRVRRGGWVSTSTFAAVTTTIAHPAAAPTIATTATMHPRGLWSHLYGLSLLRGASTYMLP